MSSPRDLELLHERLELLLGRGVGGAHEADTRDEPEVAVKLAAGK